jgi:hypothetical protein
MISDLRPQETSSRDPAAMEETCAEVSPTHSTRDTTEASSQQSENIVLDAYTLCYTLFFHETLLSLLYFFIIQYVVSKHVTVVFLPGK